MISVSEAKQIVKQHTPVGPVVKMPLAEATGLVLAEDMYSPVDVPAFAQSSMDGYAFSFAGWQQHNQLKINGIIAAGDNPAPLISPETAVRIFTGAVVPDGADSVIEQEKVTVENGLLTITRPEIQAGHNVRPKGSEITEGALALAKDTVLSPAAVGFLAGLGISEVPVFRSPVITVIVTGNELQQPGQPLERGQVYESNSVMLKAALHTLGFTSAQVMTVEDEAQKVVDCLSNALKISDFVLLTGGVSVGDYDFVVKATELCGVTQHFHKIKQKPGKPLYFGTKSNKVVFGLPGNPASVLTCFYQYVLEALAVFSHKPLTLREMRLPLASDLRKNPGLTHFLKGRIDGGKVRPLTGQESFRLSSFAVADCLIVLDEDGEHFLEGETVAVHLL